MDAVTEREVPRIGAAEIQVLGARESSAVVVRRCQTDDDLRTGGDGDAAQRDLLGRIAEGGVRGGRVVAEELVEHGRDPIRMPSQAGALVRMAKERDHAVLDQARHRVVAGHDQLEDGREQLLLAESALVVTGLQEGAHQSVVGYPLLRLDESGEGGDDAVGSPFGAFVLRRGRGRAQERGQVPTEVRPVGFVHPEQFTDHREGQGEGERRDQVERRCAPGGLDVVQELVDDRLDVRSEQLDPPHRERAGDQPPEPRVIGRVDREHVPGEHRSREALGDDVIAALERGMHVLGQSRITQGGTGFGIGNDEPRGMSIGERDPVNWAAPAEEGVQRERVVEVVRAPRGERSIDRGGGGVRLGGRWVIVHGVSHEVRPPERSTGWGSPGPVVRRLPGATKDLARSVVLLR